MATRLLAMSGMPLLYGPHKTLRPGLRQKPSSNLLLLTTVIIIYFTTKSSCKLTVNSQTIRSTPAKH